MDVEFTIQSRRLRRLIRQTTWATCIRPQGGWFAFEGVLLSVEHSHLTAVGTDSIQLAMASASVDTTVTGTVIIAAATLSLIRDKLPPDDSPIAVRFTPTLASFGKLHMETIRAPFAPWERVVAPVALLRDLRVSRVKLIAALDAMAPLTTEDRPAVLLEVRRNRMELRVNDAQIDVPCESAYPRFKIACNPALLSAGLQRFVDETVVIEMPDLWAVIAIRSPGFSYFLAQCAPHEVQVSEATIVEEV